MNINAADRIALYKNLPDTLSHLYGSVESGEKLREVAKIHTISTENYKTYVNCIGDCILGFHKTTDLPRLFQQKLQLSADESQKLASSLTEFLRPVVRRETVEAEAKRLGLVELSTTLQNPSPDRLVNPDVESATENVTPLRTMEKDISRIHGYGAYREQEGEGNHAEEPIVKSSQEDILPRKPDNLS